jgi:predicted lysophospholipase L1 biosynthesis ABC-type transport system permease subunit
MIVWQGFGFAGILIPILMYVVTVKLFQSLFGIAYTDTHAWPGAVGTLIGAGLIYWLSVALDKPGRTLLDPQTGQTVVLRKKHTVFWIPLKYIAAIMAVVGLGMLCFKSGSPL